MSEQRVAIRGPRGRIIENVRILGPVRGYTQVEIAATDAIALGIDAPVRPSGQTDNTPGALIIGPKGVLEMPSGVIRAERHVHMSPADAAEFGVGDRDVVRVRIEGERELVYGDVAIRVSPDYRLSLHLDTDEANAAELHPGAVAHLDSIQHRAGR